MNHLIFNAFKSVLAALCLFLITQTGAAQITQTLKGQVLDQQVQLPLVGATVEVLANDTSRMGLAGVATDDEGYFRIPGLAIGKYSVRVRYIGYTEVLLSNILVISGKETELRINLEESIASLNAVVVVANQEKLKPINELSVVSTRAISVEETQRFAAAVNDPGRMVSAFAGVATADDGNNHIVIRGNAPNGLLWRMEGIEIPNPNHFSQVGSSGGGISILSAQLLADSDFSTGAFAAEYGNALSGVMDMKLRRGNTDRREYTFQAGVLGLDLATEGPIGRGERRGSYLVNYRYSTLSILSKMGVELFGETNFQDLSFNVYLPTEKMGSFTLFGIGGLSDQSSKGVKDSLAWTENENDQFNSKYFSNSNIVGLTHSKVWGSNTYLKSVVAVSNTVNGFDASIYTLPKYNEVVMFNQTFNQRYYNVSTSLSHKFNAKHFVRTGVYGQAIEFRYKDRERSESDAPLLTYLDETNQTQRFNAYAQWQYRPTDKLTLLSGVHFNMLLLNNSNSLEPRLGLKYQMHPQHQLSLGYGKHSQIQPLGNYFILDSLGKQTNRDLQMSKAHHLVAGYEWSPNRNFRIRTELYFQHLYDIPVRKDAQNSYSILNNMAEFERVSLNNNGIGRNYGMELTVERSLHNGLYALLSLSRIEARYQGSDKVWRNSRFNNKYVGTLTAGKEWPWMRNGKNRSFGVNLRVTYMGGQFSAPIDLAASREQQTTVFDTNRAYSEQLPYYFRTDFGIRLKRNYSRCTTTFSMDIQNASNRENIHSRYYDTDTDKAAYWTQTPLLPIMAYKVQF
jgi:Carboxypeptidase regulatory-like domain